jgi:hypothetical protein
MKSYKDPSFQDRVGRAADAKQKALDQLRSKPPVDEKIVAERQAAQQRRDAALAEKRAAKQAEVQAAEDAKAKIIDDAKAAEAAKAAAKPKPPTAEEMKQARDARYAARKNRK